MAHVDPSLRTSYYHLIEADIFRHLCYPAWKQAYAILTRETPPVHPRNLVSLPNLTVDDLYANYPVGGPLVFNRLVVQIASHTKRHLMTPAYVLLKDLMLRQAGAKPGHEWTSDWESKLLLSCSVWSKRTEVYRHCFPELWLEAWNEMCPDHAWPHSFDADGNKVVGIDWYDSIQAFATIPRETARLKEDRSVEHFTSRIEIKIRHHWRARPREPQKDNAMLISIRRYLGENSPFRTTDELTFASISDAQFADEYMRHYQFPTWSNFQAQLEVLDERSSAAISQELYDNHRSVMLDFQRVIRTDASLPVR